MDRETYGGQTIHVPGVENFENSVTDLVPRKIEIRDTPIPLTPHWSQYNNNSRSPRLGPRIEISIKN